MILSNTADLKKYISVSNSFEFSDFTPYINKVANTFTRKYIGDMHIELKDEITGETPEDLKKKQARELIQEVFANLGFYLYLPFATVQMESSGITVTDNDERKSAEWWQIKDIRRELIRSGHYAMDILLAYLEDNKDVFSDWYDKYKTINNELLVSTTFVFDQYFHIYSSRQTFLALQPTIRQVEDQFIHTMFCDELISHLKQTGLENQNHKNLKQTLQKAIVSFTVAKVADVGLFSLDDKGLRLDFDSWIDKNKQPVISNKPSEQLRKLVVEKVAEGNNYLDIAKKIILENLTDFDQCEFPVKSMSNTTDVTSHVYNTRGILSL